MCRHGSVINIINIVSFALIGRDQFSRLVQVLLLSCSIGFAKGRVMLTNGSPVVQSGHNLFMMHVHYNEDIIAGKCPLFTCCVDCMIR